MLYTVDVSFIHPLFNCTLMYIHTDVDSEIKTELTLFFITYVNFNLLLVFTGGQEISYI